ncbi:MAG: glycosyltransferase family 2 protein [Lentisphaeria bacterium]|nr:glycosyltransferase family 2 protein [Lentisphaeria bacterium]
MREHDFRKYLKKHPSPHLPELASHAHCVVIPSYNETAYLPEVLDSLQNAHDGENTAVIVVVNHPAGADEGSSLELLAYLEKVSLPRVYPLYLPDLKGGVGEARKRGMDCFAASRTFQQLKESIIFSLDADSPVSKNYFREVFGAFSAAPDAPGVLIPVRHRQGKTREQERAIREYERYMFRYAEKLRQAGSPYGFVSIGSGFAVRTANYIMAGGMKVKKAGEDFYFLQELVKQSPLCQLTEPLVYPSPRVSERVPFGTGQAVKSLLPGGMMEDIPDKAFDCLAQLLDAAASPDGFLLTESKIIPGDTTHFLEKENFFSVWRSILQNTPPTAEARLKAFHRWFDGLKTLRFLHAVQNSLTSKG